MAFQFGEYRSLNRDEKPCLEGAKLGGDLKKYFLKNNPFLAIRHNSKSFIRCIMDRISPDCIGNGSCSSEALDPLRGISARMYGSGGAKVTTVIKYFVLKLFFFVKFKGSVRAWLYRPVPLPHLRAVAGVIDRRSERGGGRSDTPLLRACPHQVGVLRNGSRVSTRDKLSCTLQHK